MPEASGAHAQIGLFKQSWLTNFNLSRTPLIKRQLPGKHGHWSHYCLIGPGVVMIKLFRMLLAVFAFGAFAQPAFSATIFADSGWQDETLSAENSPTDGSPWSFTISKPSYLSVVDCCVPGDSYSLIGDISAVSSFFAGSSSDVQSEGSYGFYWTDSSYAKIALLLNAGTYSFSIVGDGIAGVPAGLGLRLDTVAAVPEPGTWALMIAGFGVAGIALRRRRKSIGNLALA
jgi:hypothetical protein